MRKESKKQEAITSIFQHVYQEGKKPLEFDNNLVKQVTGGKFSNQFEATKFDTSEILPPILKDSDYFVVHLGQGRHRFVRGIGEGYHSFEPIPQANVKPWPYKKSVWNETTTGESAILSLCYNQMIMQDFLYDDIRAHPKIYFARRTKTSFDYFIGDQRIEVKNLQLEIDMTLEKDKVIVFFEAKNGLRSDFAVMQIYGPCRYCRNVAEERKLDVKGIRPIFVIRYVEQSQTRVAFYEYTFDDITRPGSIRFVRNAQYNLTAR